MTLGGLAGYILLGTLIQAAIVAALAFRRHWAEYRRVLARSAGEDEADVPAPVADAPAWTGMRPFRVERTAFEDESRSVRSFTLVPVDGAPLPAFRPGQFLTLRLDLPDGAEGVRRMVTRCYSLSDRPRPDCYRISVKRAAAPDGSADLPPGVASGYLHDDVNEGAVLDVGAPGGHFFLDGGKHPVVLIAGGIGITPLLSMLAAGISADPQREFWLFYGVRNGADHALRDELQAIAGAHPNVRLHVCYSRPRAQDVRGTDYRHAGRVDLDLLRLTLPLKPFHFYICGPRAMLESVVPGLEEWGVPASRIHYEAFGPASITRPAHPAPAAQPMAGVTVTFSRSGKSLAWDGGVESLLELAEKAGIRVESGCRAGACGSCRTTIEAGEVEYSRTPDFDPPAGSCLLCVARPVRDLVLQA